MRNFKKLLSLVLISSSLIFIGCSKDEKPPVPATTPVPTVGGNTPICNCGVVISKNPASIRVTLQNTCSNNIRAFVVSYSVFDNASNGDTICVSGTTSW